MKNVLVIASTFPRWRGDTTPDFVYDLSKGLAKNSKIIVIAPHAHGAADHEKFDNVEVYRFRYFVSSHLQKVAYGAGIITNIKNSLLAKLQVPFFLLSEFFITSNLIKKYKPDIMHAHWLIPQGIVGALLKKKYGISLIITIHGSDLFPLKNFIFKYLQRIALNECDTFTVNSIATKNEVIMRFPHLKNKLKVIPMGVDTKLFCNKDVKSKFTKFKNKKIILFVGRLNEQKGIDYLIKSLPIVNKQIKNAKLLIIGEGEYKRDMQNLVDSLGLKNVEFLGPIQHQKLADYYNLADVFVLPAVNSKIGTEGQGLVLLEAMACGTVVIGTGTGGIKFIIKNNENGLLVNEKDETELAENIVKALLNNKLRHKLSKNGMKFVKDNYSWDIIVKKFDKLYNQ